VVVVVVVVVVVAGPRGPQTGTLAQSGCLSPLCHAPSYITCTLRYLTNEYEYPHQPRALIDTAAPRASRIEQKSIDDMDI
jgi:hypothetical protein